MPSLLHATECSRFAFLHYRRARGNVLVVSTTIPDDGEWVRLVENVQAYLHPDADLYYPTAITLSIDHDGKCDDVRPDDDRRWPFDEQLPLHETERPIYVESAEVGRFLFARMYAREPLFMASPYCTGDARYLVYLLGVRGWYGDDDQMAASFEAEALLRSPER